MAEDAIIDVPALVDLRASEGKRTVVLGPHQGYTVPRGVEHRTRAPERTTLLMVERATAVPVGD